jgi:uncharacterized protein (TIGR00369 family)
VSEKPARITAEAFTRLITETIPLSEVWPMEVVSLGWGRASLRLGFTPAQLRAGGTLNGPSIMTLADTALYAAVLTCIGLEPLAVTSDLSFRFLRKPGPAALCADAEILKLGRRLATGEVRIRSEGAPEIVAHAIGAYALPTT